MSVLLEMLRTHFGHGAFRAGQEALVRAAVDGRDVLAVMPTGSGKPLGYQLPALVLPGTTVVVSPLISLMKDQVDDLDRRAASPRRRCTRCSTRSGGEACGSARAVAAASRPTRPGLGGRRQLAGSAP